MEKIKYSLSYKNCFYAVLKNGKRITEYKYFLVSQAEKIVSLLNSGENIQSAENKSLVTW